MSPYLYFLYPFAFLLFVASFYAWMTPYISQFKIPFITNNHKNFVYSFSIVTLILLITITRLDKNDWIKELYPEFVGTLIIFILFYGVTNIEKKRRFKRT